MGDGRDNRLHSEKLFLYHLQLGHSMYSGKVIDFAQHSGDYDIDHIYPKSKVKYDSVLKNMVLVLSELSKALSTNSWLIKDSPPRHWQRF